MALVELTPDEVELLSKAYRASLMPNPEDRGFTVSSYGRRDDGTSTVIDVLPNDDDRWADVVRSLVEKGMFETVNLNSGRFRLTGAGVARAAEMNSSPGLL